MSRKYTPTKGAEKHSAIMFLNFGVIKQIITLCILICLGFTVNSIRAQTLGQYSFTGSNGCSANSINSQPSHATFSTFTSTGTTCYTFTANAFDNYNLNTTATINTSEYNQFTITPSSGYLLTLSNLTFTHYTSFLGSANWILRSSLDGYTGNLATGSSTSTSQNASVTLSSSFSNIGAVTFRLYVTGANRLHHSLDQ